MTDVPVPTCSAHPGTGTCPAGHSRDPAGVSHHAFHRYVRATPASASAPVEAQAEQRPYHDNAAPAGKVFFDFPEEPGVCSGTVVKEANHPGRSDLVWTAGHRVHAGSDGGWYRSFVFVPRTTTSASPRRT